MEFELSDIIKSYARDNNYSLNDEEIERLPERISIMENVNDLRTVTEAINSYFLTRQDAKPSAACLENKSENDELFMKTWRSQRRKSVYAERVTPENFRLPYNPKDDETFIFLEWVFKTNEIPLGFLDPDQRTRFINSMWSQHVSANTVFIKEGGFGSQMYIIDQGEFDVIKEGRVIKKLTRGDLFGEIALLHNTPRTATVIALCDSLVWVAEQTSFSGMRSQDRKEMVRIVLECLAVNNVFPNCNMNELERYVDTLKVQYCHAGENIIVPEGMFMVFLSGAVIDDGSPKTVYPPHIQMTSFTAHDAVRGVLVAYRFRDLISRFVV